MIFPQDKVETHMQYQISTKLTEIGNTKVLCLKNDEKLYMIVCNSICKQIELLYLFMKFLIFSMLKDISLKQTSVRNQMRLQKYVDTN